MRAEVSEKVYQGNQGIQRHCLQVPQEYGSHNLLIIKLQLFVELELQ